MSIYEVTFNITTWKWLCEKCRKSLDDKGWSTKKLRDLFDHRCDVCGVKAEEQK